MIYQTIMKWRINMANKRTNEEITIVEKFGEKLSCYSKELKISQTGLATAIGV